MKTSHAAHSFRRILMILLLFAGSLVMLFPFVWMTLSAFKLPSDTYKDVAALIPLHFTLASFRTLFHAVPFGRYFLNSLFIALAGVALTLLISVPAAYALARIRFPFRDSLRRFLMSSLTVPAVALLLPLYLTFSKAGLSDTFTGLLLPQLNIAFSTLLLARFFAAVPDDLISMAKLDRLNHLQILRHVILPSSKGPLLAASLFTFLSVWKSYLWPLMITTDERYRTLPVGLKYLMNESASDHTITMAGALLACLPSLVILILIQKAFLKPEAAFELPEVESRYDEDE